MVVAVSSYGKTIINYLYPTGRKSSLDFKFRYVLQIQLSLNLNPTIYLKLCGFPNDSIYKRIYKIKVR